MTENCHRVIIEQCGWFFNRMHTSAETHTSHIPSFQIPNPVCTMVLGARSHEEKLIELRTAHKSSFYATFQLRNVSKYVSCISLEPHA